jgi:hypothetical protein
MTRHCCTLPCHLMRLSSKRAVAHSFQNQPHNQSIMQSLRVLLAFIFAAVAVNAFAPGFALKASPIIRSSLSMSDEAGGEAETVEMQPVEMQAFESEEDKKMFDMNRRVRLGRSRDQDGKSNIWSIEPRMEVEEDEVEEDQTKKNLLIGGAVIGAAIACLPLFNAFSTLFPDPSDF